MVFDKFPNIHIIFYAGLAASAIRTASSEPEEVHQVCNKACV